MLEHQLGDVWVEGALSKINPATSGHLYFALQDTRSRVEGIMWATSFRMLPFVPTEGLQVRVLGRATLYGPTGRYQIVVTKMEPAGLGAREAILRVLRAKLTAEGVLDPQRKRPLPWLPRAIALVTSPDGAAVHDLIKVILGRFPAARLLIVPVRVQGDGAAFEIADGIRRASIRAGIDVIVTGRGGGSVEDLWAFNEEVVARAIFASPIPVVSAVGHETDLTLADEVADVRAATPSHAGQLVVPVLREIEAGLHGALERGRWAIARELRSHAARVEACGCELGRGLAGKVASLKSALAASGQLLAARHPGERVRGWRHRLDEAAQRLAAAMRPRLASARDGLEARIGKLSALNPTAVLGRGFSLTWTEDGGAKKLVRDGAALMPGVVIRTTLAAGDDVESEVRKHVERAV